MPCCALRTSPSPIPARRIATAAAGDPARHQLRAARRPDARHRRPPRQRQVDHRPSDPALLRRRQRPHHDRRPGRARRHARLVAPRRQPGAAGHLPVHRLDREQHRLWQSLGRARADRAVERGGAPARLHRRTAGRLPDLGRRARRVALGRSAPAPVDRAQHPPGAADPGVRQFHRGGRRRHREEYSRGAARPGRDARDHHHRAPAGLADGRRRDRLPRGRPDRRARGPRRAAAPGRPLRQPVRAAEAGAEPRGSRHERCAQRPYGIAGGGPGAAPAARGGRLADQHRGADLRRLRRQDHAPLLAVHQPLSRAWCWPCWRSWCSPRARSRSR